MKLFSHLLNFVLKQLKFLMFLNQIIIFILILLSLSSDAHRSTWTHLVRIWDRRVQYFLTNLDSFVPRQNFTNSGSCARTDLVYVGRGLEVPISNREFWDGERRCFYMHYSSTAIGPGSERFISRQSSVVNDPKPNESVYLTDKMKADPSGAICCLSNEGLMALDLCAKYSSPKSENVKASNLKSNSVFNYRQTYLCDSSSNVNTTTDEYRRGSNNNTNTHDFFPITFNSTLSNSTNYFPSFTDSTPSNSQFQSVYEQALFLAAAVAAASGNYPFTSIPSSLNGSQFMAPQHRNPPNLAAAQNKLVNNRSTNSTLPTLTTPLGRFGAASGTFYPPMLNPSAPASHQNFAMNHSIQNLGDVNSAGAPAMNPNKLPLHATSLESNVYPNPYFAAYAVAAAAAAAAATPSTASMHFPNNFSSAYCK